MVKIKVYIIGVILAFICPLNSFATTLTSKNNDMAIYQYDNGSGVRQLVIPIPEKKVTTSGSVITTEIYTVGEQQNRIHTRTYDGIMPFLDRKTSKYCDILKIKVVTEFISKNNIRKVFCITMINCCMREKPW